MSFALAMGKNRKQYENLHPCSVVMIKINKMYSHMKYFNKNWVRDVQMNWSEWMLSIAKIVGDGFQPPYNWQANCAEVDNRTINFTVFVILRYYSQLFIWTHSDKNACVLCILIKNYIVWFLSAIKLCMCVCRVYWVDWML